MKILVITKVFPSISETFIIQSTKELIRLGNEVRIMAKYGDFSLIHPDIKNYNPLSCLQFYNIPQSFQKRTLFYFSTLYNTLLDSKKIFFKCNNLFSQKFSDILSGRTIFYYSSIKKFSYLFPFDIANVHFDTNAHIAIILKKIGIVKFISVNFHGNDLRAGLKNPKIYKGIVNKVNLIIANSEYMKRELIKIGFPENKIIVYSPGIDLKKFPYYPPEKNRKNIKIITIARLSLEKGHILALEAINELIKNKKLPIEYFIIGDGVLRKKLEEFIEKNSLKDKVFLLGAKIYPETIEIMKDMDIFLLPSIEETFGYVLLEAMATGLPIIAPKVGGVPEIVKDGENGILFKKRETKELCKAIEYMVTNKEKWIFFSKNGRALVEKYFDGEKCGEKLNFIFYDMIKKGEIYGRYKCCDSDEK